MGFKRTSEGRVYFQRSGKSSTSTANDESGLKRRPQPRTPHDPAPDQDPIHLSNPLTRPITQPEPPAQQPPMQTEILTLLKSLNDRLKTTQAERNHMRQQMDLFREMIQDIDQKANRTEQAYTSLEDKLTDQDQSQITRAEDMAKETLKELEETRKILLTLEQKQSRYEETLADNTEDFDELTERLKKTEVRQTEIGHQVEEALTQQERLIRKIDKANEDRARFMRKIERIEEAVLQTRDSLNAKAMVLLTDQGVTGTVPVDTVDGLNDLNEDGTAFETPDDEKSLAQKVIEKAHTPPQTQARTVKRKRHRPEQDWTKWSRQWHEKLSAIPLLSTKTVWTLIGLLLLATLIWGVLKYTNNQNTTQNYEFMPLQKDISKLLTPLEDTSSDEVSEVPAQTDSAETPIDDIPDDIGTVNLNDDQAVLDMLENNPDALAERLNNIEPGPQVDQTKQSDTTTESSEPAEPKSIQSAATSKPINLSGENPGLPPVIQKIEKDALNGIPEAQHDLAAIYTAGHNNVPRDYERAAYWFEQAANQGIANASYNLGVLHHQGLGVNKADIKEAIKWYQQAADQGHPEAQYNLGIAYIEGIGVTYNPTRAAEHFKSAANGGVMEAAYNIGLIYENGLLGEAQPDEAILWYKRAADQGSPEAKAALEQLAKNLDINLDDVNRLVDSMKQSMVTPPPESTPVSSPMPTPEQTPSLALEQPFEEVSAPPVRTTSVQTNKKIISQNNTSDTPPSVVNVIEPAAGQDTANTTASYMNTQMILAQIQEQLMDAGLFPGPADGLSGPLTRDAIRSYQSSHNLPITGIADESLLQHMLLYSQGVGSRE